MSFPAKSFQKAYVPFVDPTDAHMGMEKSHLG